MTIEIAVEQLGRRTDRSIFPWTAMKQFKRGILPHRREVWVLFVVALARLAGDGLFEEARADEQLDELIDHSLTLLRIGVLQRADVEGEVSSLWNQLAGSRPELLEMTCLLQF
jgi:hypothetical protein